MFSFVHCVDVIKGHDLLCDQILELMCYKRTGNA